MTDGLFALSLSIRVHSFIEFFQRLLGKALPVFPRVHDKGIAALLGGEAVSAGRWWTRRQVYLHHGYHGDRKIKQGPLVDRIKALVPNHDVVLIGGKRTEREFSLLIGV